MDDGLPVAHTQRDDDDDSSSFVYTTSSLKSSECSDRGNTANPPLLTSSEEVEEVSVGKLSFPNIKPASQV